VHKEEVSISNKEDQEIKFLTAYIYYHPRERNFIILLTSYGKIKHQMTISLGS